MNWNDWHKLGFTLGDGQSCKAGTKNNFNFNHVFDPSKKITRIECVLHMDETNICQINFYHHKQRLVDVGWEDYSVELDGGRVEVF